MTSIDIPQDGDSRIHTPQDGESRIHTPQDRIYTAQDGDAHTHALQDTVYRPQDGHPPVQVPREGDSEPLRSLKAKYAAADTRLLELEDELDALIHFVRVPLYIWLFLAFIHTSSGAGTAQTANRNPKEPRQIL